MSGLFISMEGTDGSGKSTQIKLLEKYLSEKGFEVVCVREPGGNKISEKIRDIIIDTENNEMGNMTEALLYAAARAQLVKEVIIPALTEGNVVVCDRFTDSSIVYQGFARGLGEDAVAGINRFATGGLIPDITFFLRLNPEESIERKKRQNKLDRIEALSNNFHKRVYVGYLNLANKNKDRVKVIDADKTIEEIHNEIADNIEIFIKERSF